MYKISTSIDKPDAAFLKSRVEQMMKRGIRVENVERAFKYFDEIVDYSLAELQEEYGIDNPNSTRQIEYFLSSQKEPDYYEYCYQDGKWTSNKEALVNLSAKGYRFADVLMQYRKAKKLADSAKALMNARDDNGLIHPQVSLTKTNRISYTNPALMNIPKKLLWDVITPYKAGNKLWSADIKNQEPSILINIIGAKELMPALNSPSGLYEYMYDICFKPKAYCSLFVLSNAPGNENKVFSREELLNSEKIPPVYYSPVPFGCMMQYNGVDAELVETVFATCTVGSTPVLPTKVEVYTANGPVKVDVDWSEIPEKDLSKPQILKVEGYLSGVTPVCEGVYRKEFKTSWNAMTYGSSRMGIRAQCKHIDGDTVYDFFHKIPEMDYYHKVWRKQAAKGSQYSKTVFGTVLCANEPNKARLSRILMDLPIQGTGADILSLLVKHFDSEIESRGLIGKMSIAYTRHDEIIVEVDGDWQEEVGEQRVEELIRDILEHQINDWEPFKLEVGQVSGEFGALLNSDNDDE